MLPMQQHGGNARPPVMPKRTQTSRTNLKNETFLFGLPRTEHVTDLHNVVIADGQVYANVHPSDAASLRWGRGFVGKLPAQALAVAVAQLLHRESAPAPHTSRESERERERDARGLR